MPSPFSELGKPWRRPRRIDTIPIRHLWSGQGKKGLNLWSFLLPLLALSIALYTRHPGKTNFIFDEQEALLANPYVRSVTAHPSPLTWLDAFRRDFWGLPPERTIGSYRPIPDLVWRLLWKMGARNSPFFHHWTNVFLHGLNGSLLAWFGFRTSRQHRFAWLLGITFVATAVVTEAVSGVVGIADVLGGTGSLIALFALTLPLAGMVPVLFLGMMLALFSKESALCLVPLLPCAALLGSSLWHRTQPRTWLRTFLSLALSVGSFVLYVELRRRLFPARIDPAYAAEAVATKPYLHRAFAGLLRWYAQPQLPKDVLNNPLVEADTAHRVAGALRVFLRGLGQVLVPWPLSGDYSAPQEPVPPKVVSVESVLGLVLMGGSLVVATVLVFRVGRRLFHRPPLPERGYNDAATPLMALGLFWMLVSYFPVSNIPVLLPTVRAERFWYFPAIGTSILLALVMAKALDEFKEGRARTLALGAIVTFFFVQCACARLHANDYEDDLRFWNATRKAAPRSAKAHLNYSIMKGARGDLNERLRSNGEALKLAPQWAMAHVYYGDTLCRLHRGMEAVPHLRRGFELNPNDSNLIALGLQGLWDEHIFRDHPDILESLTKEARKFPGSWFEFLVVDLSVNGKEHNGVNRKYRPRGYNEGPKSE